MIIREQLSKPGQLLLLLLSCMVLDNLIEYTVAILIDNLIAIVLDNLIESTV